MVFLENHGLAFEVWREPFTELRVPLLFNLRRDPFEKVSAQFELVQRLVPSTFLRDRAHAADCSSKFAQTFIEFPPSQKPGSFNLQGIMKSIEAGRGG